ncbi:MAG TPA: hypothetical protein VEX38_05750 [Fimbriimonadaceae bacterium]|nr:hypothetical protein [Fimbriimonadaceae bacterium]
MPNALLLGLLVLQTVHPVLDESSFPKWRDYLAPKTEETRFGQIQWRPDFWSAVQEASQKDKPILLWTMNGHPLGCT